MRAIRPFGRSLASDLEKAATFTGACLAVAGSVTTASAEPAPSELPAVTVDAPAKRARAAPPKPTQAHVAARTALRKTVRQQRNAASQPLPPHASGAGLPTFARAPGSNPYADPRADYKADRLSSPKFTQPILNTPRSVTVLTKEVLEDKNATSLREVARSTAGVSLGTGEGGNAFGDRFFIRGFDARNDIFVDGVRDPAVSIRENFFTEQVEILRGPASSFAGRGTTGGAINIVTKQAQDQAFTRFEGEGGTDQTKRVTIDVNRPLSQTLDVRLNGLFQDAGVAGRNYVYDDRNGVAGAVKFQPITPLIVTANYAHTYLNGRPDFGVPFNIQTARPVTEGLVPRDTYYGFNNRDFTKATQNLGTLNVEYKPTDGITLSSKFRQEYSILNYIGTLPESPNIPAGTVTLNPQSRFQTVNVLANQTDATLKFTTGPLNHTAVAGVEFSQERVSIDTYNGLSSEALPGGFNGAGSVGGQSIFTPPNNIPFGTKPQITGNPNIIPVSTKAGYVTDTANYNDFIIGNAGVRYDDYSVTSGNNQGSTSVHSGLVDYNVGLVVKPTPASSLYAAYATGSQPVGAELDATQSQFGGLLPTSNVNQVFGPQRSAATEIGAKYEAFDRRLLTSAELFQTDVTNAREAVTVNGVANTVIAGAAYRTRGIDLEAQGKITDRWSVLGGLVLIDPRVTHSAVASNTGLLLANVATRSLTLLTKYQLNDFFEIGTQAVYRSQVYGGTLFAANAGTILPSYWRFDLFGEMNVGPNLTFKVFANNIFDRTYYDALYQSRTPFVLVAPGRSVTFAAIAKF
ncbi:TonB-dependent siderophore receptor [Beijerinckia sp. L45]|uniref:TonB-dependent receptor n=1 Tax=Beijerinckia sp. L45 TaxID=1641855 RepID=UPI001FEED222|nr:TonB-dependent siderophore receptor [Beijerinckia sp. L45]